MTSGNGAVLFTRAADPLLESLMNARGAQVECELEFLVVHVANPLIASILARYKRVGSGLARQDIDDLTSTIHVRLIAKLRTLPGAADAIESFEKYVATLTYNVIHDHLRKLFPARTRLKNRLRYVLTHDARLALWTAGEVLLAGMNAWRGSARGSHNVPVTHASSSSVMRKSDRASDALVAIFEATGSPIIFDALVSFTAMLWQVTDADPEKVDRSEIAAATHGMNDVSQLETREYLRVLWREIQALRPMQRKALLLNLRASDTVNVVSLIVLTRTARFDELAAALEISPESLAASWNDLPLDDLRIASMLQVTRQQVINLRKSARQRLERRMAIRPDVGRLQ